jgi:anti-sigma B factor antagonist
LTSLSVMELNFHGDAVFRDQLVTKYLYRRLSPDLVEALESHYLECNECFEEMRATELLIRGLAEPILQRKRVNDITVLRFTESSQLLAASLELAELTKAIRLENDTKVLIDLSKVSRIDSTGLGVLMNCYCHAVKNSGALKLLHPDVAVKRVLSVTRIDSVLQTFEDESAAIQSFDRLQTFG